MVSAPMMRFFSLKIALAKKPVIGVAVNVFDYDEPFWGWVAYIAALILVGLASAIVDAASGATLTSTVLYTKLYQRGDALCLELPQDMRGVVKIYDLLGREVSSTNTAVFESYKGQLSLRALLPYKRGTFVANLILSQSIISNCKIQIV